MSAELCATHDRQSISFRFCFSAVVHGQHRLISHSKRPTSSVRERCVFDCPNMPNTSPVTCHITTKSGKSPTSSNTAVARQNSCRSKIEAKYCSPVWSLTPVKSRPSLHGQHISSLLVCSNGTRDRPRLLDLSWGISLPIDQSRKILSTSLNIQETQISKMHDLRHRQLKLTVCEVCYLWRRQRRLPECLSHYSFCRRYTPC